MQGVSRHIGLQLSTVKHQACTDIASVLCLFPQAGQCGRCRAELGESGQVCQHCRLDERWLGWEMRLYSVHTRALVAGAAVSAEDALRQVPPGP